MTTKATRGIRNNNPGNIEHNPRNRWQGLDNPPVEGAGRFARFKEPVYGIRAIARLIVSYYNKNNCNTVRKIIERWAPQEENNTAAYINHVCKITDFLPDQEMDFTTYEHCKPLVVAIIIHENGFNPYPSSLVDKAMLMAGIQPPKKPLTKSRTIVGSTVSAVAVSSEAVLQVVNETKDQVEPIVAYSDSLRWIFLGLAIAGILVTLWAKFDDRKKGIS